MQREYFCDCPRHCGTRRKVSKRTYITHAPHRRHQLRNELDKYLTQYEVDRGPGQVGPGEDVPIHNNDEGTDPVDPEDDTHSDIDEEGPNPVDPEDDTHSDIDDLYADHYADHFADVGVEHEMAIGGGARGEIVDRDNGEDSEDIDVDDDVSTS